MAWTEERKDALKKLWADGLSASQIGDELGVTRNAVIGLVHRMGLPKRRENVAPAKNRVPSQRQRSARPRFNFVPPKAYEPVDKRAVVAAIVPPVEPPLSVFNLTAATCRWPVGDPQEPGFRFCGHPPGAGKPYCAAHCAMAYEPIVQSRRKRSDRHMIFRAEIAA
jgi:GcrA cell cycle regulator